MYIMHACMEKRVMMMVVAYERNLFLIEIYLIFLHWQPLLLCHVVVRLVWENCAWYRRFLLIFSPTENFWGAIIL